MTDNNDVQSARQSAGISRRTVMKGAAWSAPLLVAAVAAPLAAASGKVPPKGLNGWVTVSLDCDNGNRYRFDATQGSFVNGGTSDRGIWLFAGPTASISGATMIIYLARQDLSFTNGSTGTGWTNLVRSSGDDGTAPSGFFAYKATYSGGWHYNPTPPPYVDNNGDPQTQVWVADDKPRWTTNVGNSCNQMTSYISRIVTVDGTVYSFVRGPVTVG